LQVDLDPAALNHTASVDAPVVATRRGRSGVAALLDEVSFTADRLRGRTAHLSGHVVAAKPAEHRPGTLDIDEAPA